MVVAPNNSDRISDEERLLIKQQWFGRFILRDNSHIKDFDKWLSSLKKNYDDWTSVESLIGWLPADLILLSQDQYLLSVIEDLYYSKELTSICYKKGGESNE